MCGSKNIDSNFDDLERLFRRFCPKDLLDDKLAPAAITPPDWSVNRSKYSEPKDVLYKNIDCCGIAFFYFKDVHGKQYEPSEIESPYTFQFFVEHDPLEDNYSHSIVTVYRDNERFIKTLPKIVKRKFRFFLSAQIQIINHPKENCQNQR